MYWDAPLGTAGNAAIDEAAAPCRLFVLPLPGACTFSLAAMLEVLREANRVAGCRHFRWTLPAGADATADLAALCADGEEAPGRGRETRFDYVLVIGGRRIATPPGPATMALLRRCRRAGATIIEIASASFVLARLGLVDDAPYAVHPDLRAALGERHPAARPGDRLFSVGPGAISCCGGIGALELALHLVAAHVGRDVARGVRRTLLLPESPDDGSRHVIPGLDETQANRHLRQAIALMEGHIGDPLAQSQVAALCRVSSRQLQRLFMRHTGRTFVALYRQIRLAHARRLLVHTDMPIIEIAVACGFASASHFAHAARERWEATPSAVRRRAAEAGRADVA